MQGSIVDFGTAPFEFDDSNNDSFFIRLATRSGHKTLWSVGLKDALQNSEFNTGDFVRIKHLGKQPVEVPTNNNGEIKLIKTHRNCFEIVAATRSNKNKSTFHSSENIEPWKEGRPLFTINGTKANFVVENKTKSNALSSGQKLVFGLLVAFYGCVYLFFSFSS